ncbi:hypothetical protein DFJ77DRAFT_284800 [Powellomyces hirtus]|nr:hypothetical protein DFJ77DRAFT_284800 [Powellomyces hirtus]
MKDGGADAPEQVGGEEVLKKNEVLAPPKLMAKRTRKPASTRPIDRMAVSDKPKPIDHVAVFDKPIDHIAAMLYCLLGDPCRPDWSPDERDFELRSEVKDFWRCGSHSRKGHHRWATDRIPDPKDHIPICAENPVYYAVAASLVEDLVRWFNWKIGNLDVPRGGSWRHLNPKRFPRKLESVPRWCATVKPLPEQLVLSERALSLEKAENFWKRNIVLDRGCMEIL